MKMMSDERTNYRAARVAWCFISLSTPSLLTLDSAKHCPTLSLSYSSYWKECELVAEVEEIGVKSTANTDPK